MLIFSLLAEQNRKAKYTTTYGIIKKKGVYILWKFIEEELKKQNISVYRLSKVTGISQTTLHNYKLGHEPSFKNVVKIADALGVSLDVFRGGNGNE